MPMLNGFWGRGGWESRSLIFDLDLALVKETLSKINALFFLLVIIIALTIVYWSRYYMISRFKLVLFYVRLIAFVFSILLLISRNRLIGVFIGWEGLGVTSFILIVFYQNWISGKGGILTLLTNRLGDALLLCIFVYWLSSSISLVAFFGSRLFGLTLVVVALTKRAQWPFISWLPAAMAAPTPVRALVHSSTLVTAGIWVMVRFGSMLKGNILIWTCLGLLTLIVARLTALVEKDFKKIVALSTLRQLGLLFLSLSLGNTIICVFHILTHALAKANLFIVVGVIIHRRFAQQDARAISATLKSLLLGAGFISLLSLRGVFSIAGFFSKEQILLGHYERVRRLFSWIGIVAIVRLTIAYCLKLFGSLRNVHIKTILRDSSIRWAAVFPVLLLRSLRVVRGFILTYNYPLLHFAFYRFKGLYWVLLLVSLLLFVLNKSLSSLCYEGAFMQLKLIDTLVSALPKTKRRLIGLEASILETLYLLPRLSFGVLTRKVVRTIAFGACLILALFLI